MKTALDTYRNSMSHEELQNCVIQLAHSLGWKVAGFRKAQRKDGSWMTPVLADGKGWFDLFLANEEQRRVIAIEVKDAKDTVKPEQEAWHTLLALCGIETYVVRPEDWHSGEVDRILKAPHRRRPQPYQGESIEA
jgi:hypothetical protein